MGRVSAKASLPLVARRSSEDAEFGFSKIKLAAVLGRVVPFEALDQPSGFGGRECLVSAHRRGPPPCRRGPASGNVGMRGMFLGTHERRSRLLTSRRRLHKGYRSPVIRYRHRHVDLMSHGKVANARLDLPQSRLVRGRRGRCIVHSGRHGRDPRFLDLSHNLRGRRDRFFRGARSGPPARTDAAGRQEAAALAEALLTRHVHALDCCRARPRPLPLERRCARLAARGLLVHGRGGLRLRTMGHAREPIFSPRLFASRPTAARRSSRRDPTPSSAIPDTPQGF